MGQYYFPKVLTQFTIIPCQIAVEYLLLGYHFFFVYYAKICEFSDTFRYFCLVLIFQHAFSFQLFRNHQRFYILKSEESDVIFVQMQIMILKKKRDY